MIGAYSGPVDRAGLAELTAQFLERRLGGATGAVEKYAKPSWRTHGLRK